MKKINNPFLYGVEQLDLHGEDKIGAIVKVKQLIGECYKMKKYEMVIIHGKGEGILKKAVHEYLSHDKRVATYSIDWFNEGMTIVKLKKE